MKFDIHLLLLAFGMLATTYGWLLVFSDKFYKFMERHLWIGEEQDKRNWSPEGIKKFNKYGRGLGSLSGGIILIVFSIAYYLSH